MKKYTKHILGLVLALSATLVINAADTSTLDQWTASLGGSGSTLTQGDTKTAFGIDLSVGRTGKLFLPVEAGLRQNIAYNGSDTLLHTGLYGDWTLFTIKKIDIFAGGNVGLTYGNTKPIWSIAPEGGVRWWLKDNIAVLGRVEAPFDLVGWEFNDTVRYFLGFQVKL